MWSPRAKKAFSVQGATNRFYVHFDIVMRWLKCNSKWYNIVGCVHKNFASLNLKRIWCKLNTNSFLPCHYHDRFSHKQQFWYLYFFFNVSCNHLPLTASKPFFTLAWVLAVFFRAALICWISRENVESIIFVSRTTASSLTKSAMVKRIATTDNTDENMWRVVYPFSFGILFGSFTQSAIAHSDAQL